MQTLSGTCNIIQYDVSGGLEYSCTYRILTKSLQRSLDVQLEGDCSCSLRLPPSPVATERDPTDKSRLTLNMSCDRESRDLCDNSHAEQAAR